MYDGLSEIVYEEEQKELDVYKCTERLYGKTFLDSPPEWLQEPSISMQVPSSSKMVESDCQHNRALGLTNLPGEVYPHILQYLSCNSLDNLKRVSKGCYRAVNANWIYLDRQIVHEFEIARRRPSASTRRYLGMKVPLRCSPEKADLQEILNFSIECDLDTKCWWNYCLREVGAGEYPTDRISPAAYKKTNCAPPVWDLRFALERHCMYFFHQCKIENLILSDLDDQDAELLADCIKRSMLEICRITLNFDLKFLTQRHVHLINVSKATQVCIDMANHTIPPSLWESQVVLKSEFLRLRGFAPCDEIDDLLFHKLKASRIHIFGETKISATGLRKMVEKWRNAEKDIFSIYVINSIPHDSLKSALYPYIKDETDRMRQFSRPVDETFLYIGIDDDLFALSRTSRADENPECTIAHPGGVRP